MRNTQVSKSDTWATVIKKRRLELKMSQAELGRLSMVSRETVWRWESGKHVPETLETVALVARALDLDENRLLVLAGLARPLAGNAQSESAATAELRPVVSPQQYGLDPEDRVVRHIMELADIDDELRGYMLEHRRDLLALREQQDLKEVELLARRGRGVA